MPESLAPEKSEGVDATTVNQLSTSSSDCFLVKPSSAVTNFVYTNLSLRPNVYIYIVVYWERLVDDDDDKALLRVV